jgi:integrase
LEEVINRIPKRRRMPLFKIAAEEWILGLSGLADKSVAAYRRYMKTLKAEFGERLICDVGLDDIVRLQRTRVAQGKSPRTINYEVHTLRLILKHFNLWWPLANKVRMLKGERQPGRALSRDEEQRLIDRIRKSSSPAVLPLFIASIDSGLRASEIRALKRGNVTLTQNRDGFEGEIVVGQSKTDAGTGRVIPLTRRAAAAIAAWFERLPEAGPDAYLFPRHAVGFGPEGRGTAIYEFDFDQPMVGWKTAWRRVLTDGKVKARWHDLRHTLVSRLAEQPTVSEETIRALAGHVSRQMLSRYAHIRTSAKRAAIASLETDIEGAAEAVNSSNSDRESPQKSPQFAEAPIINYLGGSLFARLPRDTGIPAYIAYTAPTRGPSDENHEGGRRACAIADIRTIVHPR